MPIGKVILTVLVLAGVVSAQTDATPPRDTFDKPRVAHPLKSDLIVGDAVLAVPLDRVRSGSRGPETTPRSPANDCSDVLYAGVLPAAGGVLSGNTYLAGNDFVVDAYCTGASAYPDGNDEIWEFTVEGRGRWTFDTCTIPAYWDTALSLFEDIGIGCPGFPITCNGDDSCWSLTCGEDGTQPCWESAIRDVCLQAGPTYWLVVDGWSPTYWFPGTYYDVTYSRTVDPCTSDADCPHDYEHCYGIEQCVLGCCELSPYPCGPGCWCDEWLWECVCDGPDPCTAALNNYNSGWTGTQSIYDLPFWKCDDIQTWVGSGNQLVSYTTYFQARNYWDDDDGTFNPPIGTPIPVDVAIFTNRTDGSCLPGEMIPGTMCSLEGQVTGSGDPPQEMHCDEAAGMTHKVELPDRAGDTDNCEIDFFVCMRNDLIAGWQIAGDGQEIIGGPAAQDEYGINVMMYQVHADGWDTYCSAGLSVCDTCTANSDCDDPAGAGNGVCDLVHPHGPVDDCFYITWFGNDTLYPADFADLHVCVNPSGVCCYTTGGCDETTQGDCEDGGGTYVGDNTLDSTTLCEDGDDDNDGYYFGCDNCPGLSNPTQGDCNDDGDGDACDPDPADQDDDNDGCCNGVDGCPGDPAKCDPGQCGCGEDDLDSDGDCASGLAECVGHCMDCVDECNNDPDACILDEFCGCPGSPYDWDGDGVPNCVDQCPGVDDAIFGPGEGRASSCVGAIPTVSVWGLAILALLLLVAGKIYFGRRRQLYLVLFMLVLPGVALAQTDATPPRDTFEKAGVAHPLKSDLVVGDAVRAVPLDRVRPGPRGSETTPRSAANDCSDVLDAGVLPISGGVLSGNTYLAGNDFSPDPRCMGGSPYPDGNDEIWEFTVSGTGRWTFDTCTIPAGWDTALSLFVDIGMGCPGFSVTCNGDDSCGADWESAIRDVCLQAGPTYWLVVDGWSPTYWFPGTYYDVTYARTVEPCTSDAECDDGDWCNGIEECVVGCCVEGTPSCSPSCWCYPGLQVCDCHPNLFCTAARNGYDSGWTATDTCGEPSTVGVWKCDDIQTWDGSGTSLISYSWLFQARDYWHYGSGMLNPPPGTTFDVEMALFTNSDNGSCMPYAIIPGTQCTLEGAITSSGMPPQWIYCGEEAGLDLPVTLPDRAGDLANCEIDFFMCMRAPHVSGWQIAGDGREIYGGPAGADDFGVDVAMHETCGDGIEAYCDGGDNHCSECESAGDCPGGSCVVSTPDVPTGCFGATWFGGDPPADFAEAHVCVEPSGVCCYTGGGDCDETTYGACEDGGGTYLHDNIFDWTTFCEDGDDDNDGYYFMCDNCPDDLNPGQQDCNDDGEGDACDPDPGEQDNDNDGCCDDVDECDNDPAKCEAGQCGCGEDDLDRDGDCASGPAECVGHCMDCVDECNNDPGACVLDEFCGCPGTPYDWDGDGVPNCEDQCPGIDDAIFGPGEGRASTCVGAIPAVSDWGLAILALLLLVAGKIYFGRRRQLYLVLFMLVLPGVALAQTDATPPRDTFERPRVAHPLRSDLVVGDAVRAVPLDRVRSGSRGPETTPRSPANDCSDVLDAGVLPTSGGVLSGNTYLAGNDFSPDPRCMGGSPYPDGNDEIWEFTVEGPGQWTFDTCSMPAGWDTNLDLFGDIGIGCPGSPMTCNGDDSCGSYWESAIRDVCLQAGPTYWLVVDGWSPTYWFPGTYYDVTYARTVEPCTSDAECDDGDLCNGIEQCVLNCCEHGPVWCPPWECDPLTGECPPWWNPCAAALNNYNSLLTATHTCGEPSTVGVWKCDDIQTWVGSGNSLVSYTWYFQARNYWDDPQGSGQFNPPLGTTFDVETALFTNRDDGACLPGEIIPGTQCTLEGAITSSGMQPQWMYCDEAAGLTLPVILPDRAGDTANCEIDFFMCMRAPHVSGYQIAGDGQEIVGGPAAADDFGVDVVMHENCGDGVTSYCDGGDADCGECESAGDCPGGSCVVSTPDLPTGCFGATWFGGDPPADFADAWVCVEPTGACCYPDGGGCDEITWLACRDADGTYLGDNMPDWTTFCEDGDDDNDGYYFTCDNCPGLSNPTQGDCNDDGEGDACDPDPGEQDNDNDGCCDDVDECDNDPAKCEVGQCGCGEDDLDRDGDCESGLAECIGHCMDCVDECNDDPDACVLDEFCGCPGTPYDWDGDGVPNCEDQCPGIDDLIFGPGEGRASSCVGAIPTVSAWGLVILALLLLVAGKVCFTRRRQGRPT